MSVRPTFPRPRLVVANSDPHVGCFITELMALRQPVEPVERYRLFATADGYAIRDRGVVIARFEGPQFELAGKLLRLLKAEDEAPTPPCAA